MFCKSAIVPEKLYHDLEVFKKSLLLIYHKTS